MTVAGPGANRLSEQDIESRGWWRRLWRLPTARQSLIARYDAAAASWHRTIVRLGYLAAYSDMIDGVRPLLRLALSGSGERVVLDAGAGTGAFSLALAKWYHELRGGVPLQVDLLDASPVMLRQALRNHESSGVKAMAVTGDITSLDGVRHQYAVIACSHVIEHASDPVGAIAAMRGLLKPTGVLLLVVSSPHWCTRILQMKWRNAAWRAPAVISMLRDAGFKNVQVFRFRNGPPSRTSIGYIAGRAAT
jgi:2-polyprenyl-3-methyl-5-hydroxy-6-metoxy-1,4-benzoquinol methylase